MNKQTTNKDTIWVVTSSVEPIQQAGSGTSACLAPIFSLGHIASPEESIFNLPLIPHQF